MAKKNEKNKVLTEDNVAEMLGGLKRVETPNDFGIKVRAKIAERKTEPRQFSLMPIFKLAMPAAALVLLGSFLYFSGLFSSDVRDDASMAVADPSVNVQQPERNTSEVSNVAVPTSVSEVAAVNAEPPSALATNDSRSNTAAVRREQNTVPVNSDQGATAPPEGGSYRQAATSSGTPIRPPGLSPESVSRPDSRPEGFEGSRTITSDELMSLFGIDAESVDGGMKVRKVNEHGIADRSGIKNGDVITAIDDKRLTSSARFDGDNAYRSMTVLRGGQTISLPIRYR